MNAKVDPLVTLAEVLTVENLNEAWAQVKANAGASVVDGRTFEQTAGLFREHKEEILGRIREGRYRPEAVRAVDLPKANGGTRRLGIPTVATVSWTADQIMRRILPSGTAEEWRDPSGRVSLAEVGYDSSWVGRRIADIEEAIDARVALVTRLGDGLLPYPDLVLQDGDLLHIVAATDSLPRLSALLAAAWRPE